MNDNQRYQLEQNKDLENLTSIYFDPNSKYINIGDDFAFKEMNNLNLNQFNGNPSGFNKQIPKEVDDLFEDSSSLTNREKSGIFNYNINENQEKIEAGDKVINEHPATDNNVINQNLKPMDKFSIFDSGLNKNSTLISPQIEIKPNPITNQANLNTSNIKNNQIDFTGFENWNIPIINNQNNFSVNNNAINNQPESEIFNFNNPKQSNIVNNNKSKISPIGNNELKDTVKIKSRQDVYQDNISNPEVNFNNLNKKSSDVLNIDVNNLGLVYDNSSPVAAKSNKKFEIYPLNQNEINPNQNNIANLMDQNKEIDFDNILEYVNLKDNQNVNNNKIIDSKDKQKKFPSENYDFYFNANNNASQVNNNKNENFYFQDNFDGFSQNNYQNVNNNNGQIIFQNANKKLNSGNLGKQFQMNQATDWDIAYGKLKNMKERKEEVSERKTRILNDDVFYVSRDERNFIIERANRLKPSSNYDEESLNIQIQDIFNETLIKTENVEKYKQDLKSFVPDESINLSPIGFLFSVNKSLADISSLGNEIKKEVAGSRLILNEGNGFYRAFMFALLETYIVNVNLYELKKLIFDFNTKIDNTFKRKDIQINKDLINLIFSFIVDALENRKIREAYDYMIRSYFLFPDFDYGLVKFMRIAIAQYLLENTNQIFNAESKQYFAKLIPSNYFGKEGFILKNYLEDFLLSMHHEVEKIVLYVAPIVFNINLDLYIFQGIANPSRKEPKYFKKSFPCLMGGSNRINNFSSTISLFYRFSQFHKFYTNQFLTQNQLSITYSEFDTQNLYDKNKQRITNLAEIPCDICNRQSELLTFSHMPGMPICNLCLVDFINKILMRRVRNLSSESFLNKEFYCRPILIDRESNFMIYDQDTLQLVGKTIPQIIISYLDKACLFCNGNNRTDQFYTLKCQCSICQICLERELNSNTDSKIILNNFEKTYSNFKKTKCTCGSNFDTDYASGLLSNNLNIYVKQANDRLMKYAETYCIICRTNVVEKTLKGNQAIKVLNKFPINQHDDPNVANGLHIICNHCVLTVKGDILQMNRSGTLQQGSKTMPIKCSVCIGKTHQVELKNLKPFLRSSEGGCCLII